MFEAINQNSALSQRACFKPLLTSIAVHAVLAGMVVVVPLLMFQRIPEHETLTMLWKIPDKIMSILPAPPPVKSKRASGGQIEKASAGYRTNISADEMIEPKNIPITLPVPSGDLPALSAGDALSALGEGSGSETVGVGPGAGAAALLPAEVLSPLEIPDPPVSKKIVRTGVLNPSKLILQVAPVYPKLAIQGHASGPVSLEVTIDEEGNVSEIAIIKGHILLREAAVEAVKKWKYTPTIQNGEPIPIRGIITVIFSLRQ